MSIEPTVLLFREYARQIIVEYTNELKEYDKYHVLNSRLDRLKMFNTNLKLLKEKLNHKVEALVTDHAIAEEQAGLKSALESVGTEFVNEYMYIGFAKDADDELTV